MVKQDRIGVAWEDRLRRLREYVPLLRSLWRGETVDLVGRHISVEGARLGRVPAPTPPIYFGGSSAAAGPVGCSARYVSAAVMMLA